MANVYTREFFSSNLPPGFVETDPVPSGVVWVVKDICVTIITPPFELMHGFEIFDAGLVVFFMEFPPNLIPNHTYHWFGTQVLTAGQTMSISTGDATTSVRISGFQLALP